MCGELKVGKRLSVEFSPRPKVVRSEPRARVFKS